MFQKISLILTSRRNDTHKRREKFWSFSGSDKPSRKKPGKFLHS